MAILDLFVSSTYQDITQKWGSSKLELFLGA
jgi:hypothetical protein